MISSKKFDLLILIVLIITGIIAVNILGKELSWDLAAYHYYSGYAFLNNRIGFDIIPCGIQSYLNPILDIPLYFLVKYFNDYPRILMSIQSLYWAFTSFLVYLIAKKVFISKHKVFFAIFSTIAGITAFTPVLEIGVHWNDLPICIMLFISILIFAEFLYAEDSRKRTIWIMIAGLIMGMAAGLKPSATLFLIGIIISLIFLSPTCSGGGGILSHNNNKFDIFKAHLLKTVKITSLFIIAAIAGYFITNGFWMYILHSKFQNPYFPYYNNIFKSDYASFDKFMDTRHLPTNLKEYLFYPFYFSIFPKVMENAPYKDLRLEILYISILIIIVGNTIAASKKQLRFSQKLSEYIDLKFFNFITLSFIIGYIYWVNSSGILRYILPIEFVCGIYFSIVLIYLAILTNSIKLSKILAVVMIGFLFATTTYPEQWWTRTSYNNDKFLNIPDFNLPDNAIVLECGGYPSAIFIPFQNPKAKFVYIFGESNYEYKHSEKMKEEIKKLINDKSYKKYLLYSSIEVAPINWNIVKESVNLEDFECQTINNFSFEHVFDAKFYLCKEKN